MPARKEVSKMLGVIAFAVLLAGCLTQPAGTTQSTAPLPAATALPAANPTTSSSPTTAATVTRQPTDTIAPTDWSAIRCVPKSVEDISRCPQSPSPVAEKDAFVAWFARWAKQMDIYKPGPSVGYTYSGVDKDGSGHYVIGVAGEGLAGTFWFTDENGQKMLVLALANGIVDAKGNYQGDYHLIALVDETSYRGVIGGQTSQAEEIACIQPNATANLIIMSTQSDGSYYLEKAVTEVYPDGTLADGSTLRVGFIFMTQ